MDIIPLVSANKMTTCGEVKLLSRVKDSLKLADLSIGRVFTNFINKVKTEYTSSFGE